MVETLRARFEHTPHRHEGIRWEVVRARLDSRPDALRSLSMMEETGGEPDVVGIDAQTGAVLFMDCSPESPVGRRSVCYDRAALDARKKAKPETSALDMASAMGIEILDEEGYRMLQRFGAVDTKTSSWILTPPDVRSLGGALFMDYRFGRVFLYHNGADSYYGARGFRGCLRV